MWPFKKQTTSGNRMIIIRYTRDVAKTLFPLMTDDEWAKVNNPHDVGGLIRCALFGREVPRNRIVNSVLIATIDTEYLQWLKQKKANHSKKALSKYIGQHLNDSEFWDEKLCKSGMTTSYNILGIPIMLMPLSKNGNISNYCLDAEISNEIMNLLKNVYQSDRVFVPGWILKGCDMPMCVKDIVHLSEIFWSDGKRVRLGKFLEQNYKDCELDDRFSPVYCTIPFVVRSEIQKAEIDLCGKNHPIDRTTEIAMSKISFSGAQKFSLLALMSSKIPQIISVGSNSMTPELAYVIYNKRLLKNTNSNAMRTAY